MKKALKILLVLFFLIIAVFISLFAYIKTQSSPVVKGETDTEVRIEIPYGMSVMSVAQVLKENNLIKNEKIFYYVARYPQIQKVLFPGEEKSNFSLKSGIYHIHNNMTILEIQTLLSSGQQEYIKVAIPEGLTITKIAAILEENKVCSSADFISAAKNPEVAAKYSIPFSSCEGYLFPDTYFFTAGMKATDIVDIMVSNFQEKIKSVQNLSEKNAADLFETVKLASIVEREYRVEDEAPLIASVFKNRLRRTIGLYSCATVEYIITEIEGRPHPDRILISDTKIDSPYNTYLYAGLPPGPISNPGLVALDASTNTPKTQYYFFRVIDADAGRHVFSKDFDEHVQNNILYTKKMSGK